MDKHINDLCKQAHVYLFLLFSFQSNLANRLWKFQIEMLTLDEHAQKHG